MSWKIAWVVSWVGTGTGSVSGSSEELGYARNKARQEEQGPALTRSLGRFLQLATRTPHAQHPHQTTMNRRSGQSQSQKGCLCHGHRGLARKRRRAGEHPAAPQTSAWNGDGVYGNSCVRCIYLSVSGPGRLKSVLPSRARHFQMITTMAAWADSVLQS